MEYKLNEILFPYSEKNNEQKYFPVAVGKYGIRKREDIYKKELAKDFSKNKVIRKNTLTIGMGSTQIDIGILDTDDVYSVSPAYHTYKINTNIVIPKYLDWLLKCINPELSKLYMIASARQGKSVDFERMMKHKISIPSLEEQEKINKILSKIYEAKIKFYEVSQKYNDIVKSQFIEMFSSYEKVKLCDLAEIIMGQSPNSKTYNDYSEGVPFFQGKADFGDKYTIVRHWTNKPTKIARKNSVLLSVRAPVGPVNLANEDCCIGRGLCSINALEKKTNNEFLYNALKNIEKELSLMGSGSTFKAINKNDVQNLIIPDAPYNKQIEYVNFISKIDKSKYFGGDEYGIC